MIQFFNVCKAYQRDQNALSDVTLKVEKGEFVYLTGPSGAGKSTVFDLATGFREPSSGSITVGGNNPQLLAVPTLERRAQQHTERGKQQQQADRVGDELPSPLASPALFLYHKRVNMQMIFGVS